MVGDGQEYRSDADAEQPHDDVGQQLASVLTCGGPRVVTSPRCVEASEQGKDGKDEQGHASELERACADEEEASGDGVGAAGQQQEEATDAYRHASGGDEAGRGTPSPLSV